MKKSNESFFYIRIGLPKFFILFNISLNKLTSKKANYKLRLRYKIHELKKYYAKNNSKKEKIIELWKLLQRYHICKLAN